MTHIIYSLISYKTY